MSGVQKSLRLPEETLKEIEEIASETGQDFSATAKDLLVEAIKMRRCQGFCQVVVYKRWCSTVPESKPWFLAR